VDEVSRNLAVRRGIERHMSAIAVVSGSPARRTLAYPVYPEGIRIAPFLDGRYRVRFAEDEEDLDAVLRLRFEVFNLELNEGLAAAYKTGRDEDGFDRVCHHLLVEDMRTSRVVGTYRVQTAEMAASYQGFYSADEFDLAPLSPLITNAVELGRACVTREHRNRRVLFLLWKGLADYLVANRKRYLFGCCSLTSQNAREGWQVMDHLVASEQIHPDYALRVQPEYFLPRIETSHERVTLPTLFQTYMRYGAKVCGGPALDRQFKTIDYLVLLDVNGFDKRSWAMFFGDLPRMA